MGSLVSTCLNSLGQCLRACIVDIWFTCSYCGFTLSLFFFLRLRIFKATSYSAIVTCPWGILTFDATATSCLTHTPESIITRSSGGLCVSVKFLYTTLLYLYLCFKPRFFSCREQIISFLHLFTCWFQS